MICLLLYQICKVLSQPKPIVLQEKGVIPLAYVTEKLHAIANAVAAEVKQETGSETEIAVSINENGDAVLKSDESDNVVIVGARHYEIDFVLYVFADYNGMLAEPGKFSKVNPNISRDTTAKFTIEDKNSDRQSYRLIEAATKDIGIVITANSDEKHREKMLRIHSRVFSKVVNMLYS